MSEQNTPNDRTTITIDRELYNRIRAIADRNYRRISDQLRAWVDAEENGQAVVKENACLNNS